MSDRREAFERWHNGQLNGDPDNCPHKEWEWHAWQAALASRDVEPVAWKHRQYSIVGFVDYPPNLSAAVAAAIEQAAEVVEHYYGCHSRDLLLKHIRALQSPDGLKALREFGMKVGVEAQRTTGIRDLEAVVDRVLK